MIHQEDLIQVPVQDQLKLWDLDAQRLFAPDAKIILDWLQENDGIAIVYGKVGVGKTSSFFPELKRQLQQEGLLGVYDTISTIYPNTEEKTAQWLESPSIAAALANDQCVLVVDEAGRITDLPQAVLSRGFKNKKIVLILATHANVLDETAKNVASNFETEHSILLHELTPKKVTAQAAEDILQLAGFKADVIAFVINFIPLYPGILASLIGSSEITQERSWRMFESMDTIEEVINWWYSNTLRSAKGPFRIFTLEEVNDINSKIEKKREELKADSSSDSL